MVRHAAPADEWEAESRLCGWYDPPLGGRGRRQAAVTAEWLAAHYVPAIIYASPLRRAWQTAEVLAERLALPVVPIPDVREVNCGLLDGMPLADVREQHPRLWEQNVAQRDETFRWPGGESYGEFRIRVRRAIEGIVARHEHDDVIVVTHTGVITQTLGMLRGWGAARWDRERPRHAALVEVCWPSPATTPGFV